jgi:hypothetical protein
MFNELAETEPSGRKLPSTLLRVSCVATSIALSMWASATEPSEAADGDRKELLDRITNLESQVQALRSQVAQQQQNDPRDVDAVVAAVLQDASRHSLAFPPGGSSGHDLDKGFFIKSDDGNFALYPDLLFQFRGVANYREDAKKGGSSSTETGFEVRRAKFGFYGTAFSPDFSYRFLWQDSTSGGSPSLQYGFGQYIFAHDLLGALHGDLAVRAGQFKNIVFKEEFTPDRAQLLVERSLANALLGGVALGSETQGVDLLLTGAENPLHVDILFDDGIKSSNTDFRDNQPVTVGNTTKNVATNFGVAGRVDYKFFGRWGDGDDFTGVWGRQDLLIVGGGVDFSQGDNNNTLHYTVDAQYQLLKKLAFFAGFYGDYISFRNQSGPSDRTDYGGVIQAGYFIKPGLQVVARYSIVKVDENFKVAGVDTFHEIAGGLNWFFGKDGALGNHAKLSFDLNYLPNGAPAQSGLDYLASPSKHDEWVLRTQLQLSL